MAVGLRARTFALLLYLTSVTTVSATGRYTPQSTLQVLQRRQSSCPAARPVSCAAVDSKLPNDFCCPANSACISLDSSSSALCCPDPDEGGCNAIELITCDVRLQNPASSNLGPVLTSRLNDKLPTCGNACCPFGYTCETRANGENFCQLDQSKAITSNKPTQLDGIDSTQPQTSNSANPFPPGVFFAGFVPGMIIGALAVLAWVILTGRHTKSQNGARAGSEYGQRPSIKDPYEQRSSLGSSMIKRTKTIFQKKEVVGSPGLPFDDAAGWRELTPPVNNIIPPPGATIAAGPGAMLPRHHSIRTSDISHPEQIVNEFAYPMSPSRASSFRSDPTGEMVRIYTPTKPAAVVPPLRGMNTQRRSKDFGSRDSGVGNDYVMDEAQSTDRALPPYPNIPDDDESVYDEILTAESSRRPTIGEGEKEKKPRPETTFTEMLRQINFPDPDDDHNAPAVPTIPREYQN